MTSHDTQHVATPIPCWCVTSSRTTHPSFWLIVWLYFCVLMLCKRKANDNSINLLGGGGMNLSPFTPSLYSIPPPPSLFIGFRSRPSAPDSASSTNVSVRYHAVLLQLFYQPQSITACKFVAIQAATAPRLFAFFFSDSILREREWDFVYFILISCCVYELCAVSNANTCVLHLISCFLFCLAQTANTVPQSLDK